MQHTTNSTEHNAAHSTELRAQSSKQNMHRAHRTDHGSQGTASTDNTESTEAQRAESKAFHNASILYPAHNTALSAQHLAYRTQKTAQLPFSLPLFVLATPNR